MCFTSSLKNIVTKQESVDDLRDKRGWGEYALTHNQMTNFRLFQTERVRRRQFLNLTKIEENYPNRRKTLWEKEKLLVTSNFSFSYSVFKRLVSLGRQKVSLCGNGLILSQKINFRLF